MSRTDTPRDSSGRLSLRRAIVPAARTFITQPMQVLALVVAWSALAFIAPTNAQAQDTCETPGTGISGSWSDADSWVDATCPGGIPQAGDNVIIRDDDAIDLQSSVSINNITIEGDDGSNDTGSEGFVTAALGISASFFSSPTITVTGDIVNDGILFATNSAFVSFNGTSSAQTLSGSADMSEYNLPRISIDNADGVVFSQGVRVNNTAQINSELTVASISQFEGAVVVDGTFTFSSDVRISGDFFLEDGGSTVAVGDPTVIFNGTSSQTIDAAASVSSIPFATAITITNTGGVEFSKAVDLEGDLLINSGLTLAGPLSLAGDFTNNGTFDATTNDQPVTFDGTALQTIAGSANFHDLIIMNTSANVRANSSAQVAIDNDLTINPGATFAHNSTEVLDVVNDVDIDGTLTLSNNAGGDLSVGGTFDVDAATGSFDARTRVVTFDGAGTASPQTVSGGTISLYDLSLSGETTLDLNSTVEVQAALTLGDETGANETLNTNGNLVLLSTAARDAALLYRGGTVNGTARIERFLAGDEIGPEYAPVGSAPVPPQIGDDAGWRHLAFPALSGGNPVLASSLVDAADDEQLIVDVFDGSMIYEWDPTTASWVAGSPSTQLGTGQGAAVFFFDDNVDPILASSGFKLYAEGTVPSSASTTVDFGTTSELYLVGNPYPSFFDLTAIEQGGTSFISTGDFQNTVQVWESARAEDSAADADDIREPRGGYTPITVDALLTSTSDRVAPWQGFFIERSPSASGAATLDFNTAGTFSDEESDLEFIKSEPATAKDVARLELELSHECGEARCVLDRGTQVFFHPDASEAFDPYDASKITMRLEQNAYGVLALAGMKYGEPRMKAVESRALPLREALTLDLDLGLEGMTGAFTIRAATWEGVPSDWRVTLVDRTTGEEAALTEDGDGYTFTFDDPAKARVRNALANRKNGVPQPAPVLYAGSSAAKSGSGTRFELRIEPTAYIPADIADFRAQTQRRSAVLTWQTTAETNNARFEIDKKVDGAFKKIGEEDAAGTPQTYSYTVSDLDIGTHTFRLREIGVDETEKVIDEVEIRIDLAEEYVLRPAYPNPFTDQATVEFAVQEANPVTVELFNVIGQRVKVLYQGTPTPSEIQRVALDARGLGSGLYVVRMRGEGFSTSETVTLVR